MTPPRDDAAHRMQREDCGARVRVRARYVRSVDAGRRARVRALRRAALLCVEGVPLYVSDVRR